MSMAHAALHRFNVKEYYRMAEIGVLRRDDRVELLDDVIVDMPPIRPPHSGMVNRLNHLFHSFPGDRWLMAVHGQLDLDEYSEPEPDLMLLRFLEDFYRSHHPKPEEVFLLIEVSDSTLETDRAVKLPLYARAGIAEVWIVNLIERTVEIYREPHFSGYSSSQILHRGDKIAPAQFPDAVIEVADLLGR
jgi:Uma2 family endonuclease